MLLTLAAGSTRLTGYAFVESVTWAATGAREAGELVAFVPRRSNLWHTDLLREDGGALCEFAHATLGRWRGITQPPDWAPDGSGATIRALDFSALAAVRVVGRNRVFTVAPAGTIARFAVLDAFAGLGAATVHIESTLIAPPLIHEYTFSGQSLASVLGDLAAQTGQEWSISVDWAFRWLPVSGSVLAIRLTEGGDLLEVTREVDASERVTEVVAVSPGGRTWRAVAPELRGDVWRQQVAVSVESENDLVLGRRAFEELASRRAPTVSYAARLVASRWAAVREGDWVRLVLPRVRFAGDCPLVRVAGRSWSEGAPFVELRFAAVREFAAEVVPTGYGVFDAGAAGVIPPEGGALNNPIRRLGRIEDQMNGLLRFGNVG